MRLAILVSHPKTGVVTHERQILTMVDLKKFGYVGAGAAGVAALALVGGSTLAAQEEEPTLDDPEVEEQESETSEDQTRRGPRKGFGRGFNPGNVDRLVEEGIITEEQAQDLDSIVESVREGFEEKKAQQLAEIADVLGMSADDLEAALDEGQTLAEVAGDDLPALVDHMVDNATERIEAAVADGELSQERADAKLEGLEDRIQNRLENGRGFKGHGGPRNGPGADADEAAPETAATEASFT